MKKPTKPTLPSKPKSDKKETLENWEARCRIITDTYLTRLKAYKERKDQERDSIKKVAGFKAAITQGTSIRKNTKNKNAKKRKPSKKRRGRRR